MLGSFTTLFSLRDYVTLKVTGRRSWTVGT